MEKKLLILHKLDKSWLITWTAGLLVILTLIISIVFPYPSAVKADISDAGPTFRIVEVRAEHGQLALEVQHFKPDGSHWFYEMYSWEGSEEYNRDRVQNNSGHFLLEDGSLAPFEPAEEHGLRDQFGVEFFTNPPTQYLPSILIQFGETVVNPENLQVYANENNEPVISGERSLIVANITNGASVGVNIGDTVSQVLGMQGYPDLMTEDGLEYTYYPLKWMEENVSSLKEAALLDTITSTHVERFFTGWNNNRGRLVLPSVPHDSEDIIGSNILQTRFEYLAGNVYTIDHNLNTYLYEGSIELALVDEVAERVDLRTANSKTYQVGEDEFRSIHQSGMHYKDTLGNWVETSLEFRPVEGGFVMDTHPEYSVFGSTQYISMITPEGDVGARWYTPTPITYEKTKAYYIHDGLKWEYILTNSGLKLVSEVISPKGPKSYEFVFLALGEAGSLSIDSHGNATTNQFQAGALDPGGAYFDWFIDEIYLDAINQVRVVVPRSKIIGADKVVYDGGFWEIVDDYRIKFSFDDSILPDEAYPYVIDPTTTFNVSSGTDDGHITASSGSFPPTYSSMDFSSTSFRVKNSSGYTLEDAYIRFDTSSLPNDALVISAQLKLACHSYSGHAADNAMLHAAWVQGASWPITSSHLYRSSGSSYGAAQPVPTNAMEEYPLKGACGGPLNQGNHNAYTTYELMDPQSNVQATSWPPGQRHIKPTGYSGLRLGIRMDVGSGSNAFDYSHQYLHENVAPTGSNEMTFHSSEHGSELTPQLVVTYTHGRVHVCPSATAQFFTNTTNAQSGRVMHTESNPGQSWEHVRLTTSTMSLGNPVSPMTVSIGEYSGTGNWAKISRGIVSFDTASLPDDAVITHGYVSMTGAQNNVMSLRSDWDNRVFLTDAYPANPALVAASDYQKVGYMPQAILIDYDIDHDGRDTNDIAEQWSTSDAITKHNFFLTAIGRGYIKADGVTSFGLRLAADLFDEEPIKNGSWNNTSINYQQVAVTSGQNPMLTLTYQVPCSEIDSTSTVSNTTVSTLYSSNLDGRVNRYNAGNVSFQNIRELPGTSMNSSAHSESFGGVAPDTRASGTYYSNFWSYGFRTFFNFDTQSLPNYTCTTGTATFQPGTSGNATDGILGHTSVESWEVLHNISTSNIVTENGTDLKAAIRSDATTNKFNLIIRPWMHFDVESTIPDDAIITYAKVGIVVTSGGLSNNWPASGNGAWTYPAASIVSHRTSAGTVAGGDFRGQNEDGNPGFGQLKMAEDRQIDTVISGMTSKYVEDGVTYTWTPLNTRGLDVIDAAKTLGSFPDDGVARFGMRLDWDAQGYRQAQSMYPFPQSYFGPAPSYETYVKFHSIEAGASLGPKLYVEWTVPCSIHSAFVRFSGGKGNSNATRGEDRSFALTTSGIASDTALAMTDFQATLGYNTELSDRFPVSSWTDCFDGGASWAWEGAVEDCTAEDGLPYNYNYFGLNDRGKVYINDTGSTNFVLRHEWDMDGIGNVNPGSGRGPNRGIPSSDGINGSFYEAGAGVRPELVVVHGSLTPTSIGTAALFQSAGQTIIININGANFNNPLSTSDKQAIIDGITGSLGAGSSNWNEAVRDTQTTGVVAGPTNYNRTVTVTFEAAPTFNPSASIETISVAIPASVITTNSELISLPGSTFQVDQIPFGLTSISPTLAGNSGSLELTLNGLGLPGPTFTPPETVIIFKSGAPASPITCTPVSGGGTSVVVSCPVNGIQTGDWSVKATDAGGLNDTLTDGLTLYEPWSSTVNGGGFSDTGSDFGIFAHDAIPYFTIQAFDEIEKEWLASSALPATIPTAAGKDAQFTSGDNGKDRFVVGTATDINVLWAYEFDPTTGIVGATTPSNPSIGNLDINDLDIGAGDNIIVAATDTSGYVHMFDIDEAAVLANFWTSIIAAPSLPPGAECNTVDINSNATYVAIGCTTSPYLHVWAINNGASGTPSWGAKSTPPTSPPTSSVTGVKFSPNDSRLAITEDNGNILVYDFFAGAIGNVASQNITATSGYPTSVSWLKENVTGLTVLAVGATTAPYVHAWNFDTSETVGIGCLCFVSKIDDPSAVLTSQVTSVDFHPNHDIIVLGQVTSPFITAYNFQGVSDDDYRVYRYMLNFDTSYLPDDAILSVVQLQIVANSVNHGDCVSGPTPADCWDMLAYDAQGLTTLPLNVVDYDHLIYGTSDIGSINSFDMDTPSTYFAMSLSNSVINKVGVTQILLRHEDDVAMVEATSVETVDLEVGWDGTTASFPSDCVAAAPTALTGDSQYNLCNSNNLPYLQITYTSPSNTPVPDLTSTFTNTNTADTDGTYSIDVLAKGPLVIMTITGSGTPIHASGFNRVIPDTAGDWDFVSASSPNRPFPFVRSVELYERSEPHGYGPKTLWYELDGPPSSQMIDRTGTVPDDTESSTYFSLPLDSTLLSSIVGKTRDASGALISVGAEPGSPEFAVATNSAGMSTMLGTSTRDNDNFFMGEWFDYVETNTGMPIGVSRLAFALVVTIALGVIAFKSFQSVAASYIVILISIVGFTLSFGGIFEWWMLLTFGMTAGVFIFARRAYV